MKKRRLAIWTGLGVAGAVALLVARPAFHLARAAWRDGPAPSPPPGFVDDASRMNLAAVSEVVELDPGADLAAAEGELVSLLERARREGLHVSIAGARHTMGGHTIYPGGISLSMRGLRHMELDEDAGILHVGAGAMGSEVIAYLDAR
jgi:FAD/FMN-containing dehydrogenase